MLPTPFELAQLAALMTGKKWTGLVPHHLSGLVDENKLTAPDAALGLWEQCQKTLNDRLIEHLLLNHFNVVKVVSPEKSYPIWEQVMAQGKFPVQFDDALKSIMEIKRRDGRHKAFRDFLCNMCLYKYKNDSIAKSVGQKLFDYYKANGFDLETFQAVAESFPAWKSLQATKKARNNAGKRWEK